MIHKRMLDIVPEDELKRYIESKSVTLDDYYLFRKQFGYSYGPVQLINYIFGNECHLRDLIVDLSTASIEIESLRLRTDIKENIYSVRLSRNISHFMTQAIINGTVLPSMIATVSAILKPDIRIKSYFNLVFREIARLEGVDEKEGSATAESLHRRLKSLIGRENDEDVHQTIIPNKMRVILETAEKVGSMSTTPINLKCWF